MFKVSKNISRVLLMGVKRESDECDARDGL